MSEKIYVDSRYVWNAIQTLRELNADINMVENEIARVISKHGTEVKGNIIDSANDKEYKKVVRAEWIDTGMPNAYGGKVMKCSNCGTRLIMSPERYENRFEYERFCSCCGAMIYEKDDED